MSLRVWLPLNGNLDNLGLDNVTVSSNNITFTDGKIGKAATFNNSRIGLDGVSLTNQSTDFSFCFWLNASSPSSTGCLYNGRSGIGTPIGIFLVGGALRFDDGSNHTTNAKPTANEWHHYAFTRNSSKITVYQDGIKLQEITSTAIASTTIVPSKATIGESSTGSVNGGGGNFFAGKLNDYRIYDHCLSPKEVHDIAQGLVLHYKLTGNSNGISPNMCRNTNTNSITTNTFFMSTQYGGKTREIVNEDGINCVKITRNDVDISTGWVYMQYQSWDVTSVKTATKYVVSVDFKSSASGTMTLTGFVNGNATNYMSQTVTAKGTNRIVPNEWCHCSWVVTTKDSFDAITVGSQVVYFGGSRALYGVGETLMMKNLKVEEGTVETAWIPHTTDALYTAMGYGDTIEYDCSGFRYNATRKGNPVASTDTVRYRSSTLFQGNSYIMGDGNNMPKPKEQITISAWIKPSVNTGTQAVVECYEVGGAGIYINAAATTATLMLYANGGYRSVSTVIAPNEWSLVTGVYDKTALKIYVNGEFKNQLAYTYDISYNSTAPWAIACNPSGTGGYGGEQYAGNISDVRVYATALSAKDILELYETRASIDNHGNIYGYELEEV